MTKLGKPIRKRDTRLVGVTIASVDPEPAPNGRGGTYHSPTIVLSNGIILRFQTEETEVGEYGTLVLVIEPA